jgi:hypothetical protein
MNRAADIADIILDDFNKGVPPTKEQLENWIRIAIDSETRNWKEIALHLADCQAATAYHYTNKSASKSEARRHVAICTMSADAIETGVLNKFTQSKQDVVVQRLRDTATAVKKSKGFEPEK